MRDVLVLLFAVSAAAPWLACVSEATENFYHSGYRYGVRHDLAECLDESLALLYGCEDAECQVHALAFSRGCAVTASPNQAFCAEVPDSIWGASRWMKSRCASHAYPKACYKVTQQPTAKCP